MQKKSHLFFFFVISFFFKVFPFKFGSKNDKKESFSHAVCVLLPVVCQSDAPSFNKKHKNNSYIFCFEHYYTRGTSM